MQTSWKYGFFPVLMAVLLPAATADDNASPPAAIPVRPAVFSVHDSNQDGYLDRGEYQHMREHLAGFRRAGGCGGRRNPAVLDFGDIDADANGYISEDEMLAALNKRLRKHRRNRYHGGR